MGSFMVKGEAIPITVSEMEELYPNQWLFIIEPEYYEGSTRLKSGIVQIHNNSKDRIYEASRQFKGNAAIRFIGDDSEQRLRPKMTSYRPRNVKVNY